jgi:hypothetical protein
LDNRAFTPNEKTVIAERLDEIKKYILEGQQAQSDHVVFVDQEFSYLRNASDRLGRKDWLNVALSVLVNVAVGLALNPEKARGVLRSAGTLLQWIWGKTAGLLP